jgi:hypothetical protein
MTKTCKKWKDQLLEAALTGARPKDLEVHLQGCRDCAAELRDLEAFRVRQDALLPLLVKGAQPSAGFRARVLAAAEASGERKFAMRWRSWKLAGAAATAVTALVFLAVWRHGSARKIQPDELATAQKLAEWRAPSDSLLATPGQEILRTTPKLGGSYLSVPINKAEEE